MLYYYFFFKKKMQYFKLEFTVHSLMVHQLSIKDKSIYYLLVESQTTYHYPAFLEWNKFLVKIYIYIYVIII